MTSAIFCLHPPVVSPQKTRAYLHDQERTTEIIVCRPGRDHKRPYSLSLCPLDHLLGGNPAPMLQKLTGTRKRGLRRKATWEKPTPTCQPCNCAILETDPSVQLSLYMAPADT